VLRAGETELVVDEIESGLLDVDRGLYRRGSLIVSPGFDRMQTWDGKTIEIQIIEEIGDFALLEQIEAVMDFVRFDRMQMASFLDETPTAVLVRQVRGTVAQFKKQALVAKLRKARERKKAATGKCGGRRSVAEAKPETVALAKKLARYPVNGHHRSLREIAAELEAGGACDQQGHALRRYRYRPHDRVRGAAGSFAHLGN
jgi:hypothetical protein